MPEIFRSRDCVVLLKDDAYTATVDAAMVAAGWPGGQGVRWVDSAPSDEFLVTFSDGRIAGFLVWGSDETGDDHTATTRNQQHYQFATLFGGSALILTTSFEQFTLASRLVGPLVPLTYNVNDRVYFSLRGLWTVEDEMTISGHPQAPASSAGYVAQVPKSINGFWVGIQTTI